MRADGRNRAGNGGGGGFTLVELLVVIAIIGILLGLILTAAMGGIRQAERRATESLITKLETALTDRMDALASTKVLPTFDHNALAATYFSTATTTGVARAQVWAQYDYLRSELPDVWIPSGSSNYPINFGAVSNYPGPASTALNDTGTLLPIGAGNTLNPAGAAFPTGIWGASFNAAGGIYSQIGYAAAGTNGADDSSPPDGFPDDIGESGMTLAAVTAKLSSHTHKTARAEMLYAILVQGTGRLGSALSRDDFTANEVQDTDGDGLLEFVDAWGEPLQFYRWPIFYHSDYQKGVTVDSTTATPSAPYQSVFELREQSPLDPNQQLMAVTWWSNTTNSSPPAAIGFTAAGPLSAGAVAFQNYFHLLVEPAAAVVTSAPSTPGAFWDRGSLFYQRRAFYTRPLIISGGEDHHVGIPRIDQVFSAPFTPAQAAMESQARQCDFTGSSPYYLSSSTNFNPLDPTTREYLQDAAGDDISNHNISAAGGAFR